MEIIRVELKVVGKVQKVGFRWCSQKAAGRIGLSGFCQNLADGSVQIQVQGNEEDVNRFISWAYHGVPDAAVDRVDTLPIEVVAEETEFIIRH